MSGLQQYLIDRATRFGEYMGKEGSESADGDVRFTKDAGRSSGSFRSVMYF